MSDPFAFTVNLDIPFENALDLVTDALEEEGFGVLTKIDVKETMKKKPGEDFRPSIILGACNPPLAYSAISSAPEVGIKLPCNVTVEKTESGVLISLANPEAMMMGNLGENTALREVVAEARSRLERVAKTLRA